MEKKGRIIYSDTIKAVISDPPGKMVRRGTLVIFSVFLLLIVFAVVVPYPDVIVAPVEITTKKPPVTLLAKKTGRINVLYAKDGDNVSEGQILAVMETAALIREILSLKTLLGKMAEPVSPDSSVFPLFSGLGEMQDSYAKFIKCNSDYLSYIRNDIYATRIVSINREITRISEFLLRTAEKESLLRENVSLQKRKYERDSILYQQKVLPELAYENSRQTYIGLKLELQQVRIDYSSMSINLSEKEKAREEYKILRTEERESLQSSVNEAFLNLKAGLNLWMNQYLIISPVNGTVSFTGYWSENQSVLIDKPVMTIVPENPGDFIGRINLKMYRSGKVREGMKVNLKLSGYPYLEYGMVKGLVTSKSLVPSEDSYIIEISLPDGLTTQYGKKLEFNHNMQGTAEIVTNRLTLMQKLIDPFRYVASKIRQ